MNANTFSPFISLSLGLKKKIQLIINLFEVLTEGQVPRFLSGLHNIWYTLSFLDNTVVCQMYDNTFTMKQGLLTL